jgi:hypothetical protein
MTAEVIRDMLHAAPFVPFTVHVADGKSLMVKHPDFATLTQGGQLLFVNTVGDKFEWVDVSLVTRVESTDTSHMQPK